jgi:NAD(P)-dependent dehydrogenase (short-subunit alcohol dehydrogenase family)
MARLANKVALVTGAAQGIGRASALRLSEEGARVVVTDLNETLLAETRAAIEAAGGEAVAVAGDIVDPATSDRVVAAAVESFGGVDVLLNNVGMQFSKSLADTTVEEFEHVMRVNVLSQLLTTQRAVPQMRRRGGGSIINIASIGGLVALPNVGAYGASKSAVIGLTRSIAYEFAPEIRCNAICPGGVETPMSAEHLASFDDKEHAMSVLTGRQLIKRYAKPREIADVVVFLASDESSFMTGAVVPVEAGHSAW